LIVWGFTLGWVMTDIPGFTPTKLRYFSWHKWIGVTVFALVLVRILWRATHAAPALPASTPAWERRAAHAGHAALYLLMVAVPLTGYFYTSAAGIPVVYLGIWQMPTFIGPDTALKGILRTAHVTLDYTLLAVVVLHVLAVIKHHLFDRQNILARMLPFGSARD
jgi:cytochrome b561